jgi:dTDP-4-amino-4,6-dideoxygalactose transaminase
MTTQSTGAASRLAVAGGTPARKSETRQFPRWSEEARQQVAKMLEEGVSLGLSKHQPQIAAVEEALASYHGVPCALGTSTGNGALHAALIGLELTAGDEVMTSPYTYGVSISTILQNNCIPSFADVIEGTGLIDPQSVRERITERTRALFVPHIFGSPADMTELGKIAEEHDLKVIEDGSQAHGSRHRGTRIGSFGDAAGFSSNGVKPLAATEAGYMVTKHEDLYWKAVVSTQHAGMGEYPGRSSEPGFPEQLGDAIDGLIYTFRLTPLNAVLLLDGLQRLDANNEIRQRHLAQLSEGIRDLQCVEIPALLHEGDESTVHQVVVRFDEEAAGVSKETYLEALNAEGLYAYEYLKRPVHQAPRLSPDWAGPRVMWTENLKRANVDPTTDVLPHVENQIRNHFNLVWNYPEYEPELIAGIVDVFVKVDENLDELRQLEASKSR